MNNLLKEKINLAQELGGILQKYRELGAKILLENASTTQEIEERIRIGLSMERALPLQEKYIITIIFDYPKIGGGKIENGVLHSRITQTNSE